jgi:hypothetical protein
MWCCPQRRKHRRRTNGQTYPRYRPGDFFVTWGTLLGIQRHGGLIPWDADCDMTVVVNAEDFEHFMDVAIHRIVFTLRVWGYQVHKGAHAF